MKKICLSILIFIFTVSMFTMVNAATGSIEISSDSATVSKGNTVKVNIVGTSDSDITGFEAKLSFDNTKLAIQSKSAGSNFTDLSGSDSEIAVLSTGNTAEKVGTIYTITFKVLDNAEIGNTTISISNATLAVVNSNAEQENLELQVNGLDVEIKEANSNTDNTNNNNENDKNSGNSNSNTNPTDNNLNNNNSDNNSNNDSTDSNKDKNIIGNKVDNSKNNNDTTAVNSAKKLPQTGLGNVSLIIIIALVIILAVSYIGYNKYKKVK